MNRYKLLFFTSIVVIAGLVVWVFVGKNQDNTSNKETVIIDSFKVFEGFQLKKDYDAKIEKEFATEKAELDSMGYKFNTLKNPLEIDALKKQFVIKKRQFDEKFQTVSQKYTNEVYERLNTYIKEFGKKNNFGIIIGSNGQGNVMYRDEAMDVTEKLITFINDKYSK
jgi:outer membrane protein